MVYGAAAASGFFRTRITESPLRNILAMNLSLFTGLPFFCPANRGFNMEFIIHPGSQSRPNFRLLIPSWDNKMRENSGNNNVDK